MELINYILLSFGIACFSAFLEFCFMPAQILSFYYGLIYRLPKWLFKPLGGCTVCMNYWITSILYFITFNFSLIHFVFFVGISYISLRLVSKV